MSAAIEALKKLLVNLFRIQPGEGTKTALMFGIMLCVVGAFITGRVARDSLFLSRYSLDYLPYLYIWVALGISAQSYLFSRIADRFRRDKTLLMSLAVILGLVLIARLSLEWVGSWFYPVLYVFVELFGAMLIIQVWTLANDVFTTREAKRLYALVSAGGVVSAVIVGIFVRSLVKLIGTENLLLFCATCIGVASILAVRISYSCREEIFTNLTESHRRSRARITLRSDWGRIFGNRHLLFVATLVVVVGLVMTFVDYQFKVTARDTYLDQEEQLAGFFGLFWAITGVVSCFILFFVTGRILERLGILFSLLLLPVFLIGGAAMLLIVPTLLSATMLKGTDTVFRYTVNDATVQILYLPVPPHVRGRVKAFIDGILRPLSIGTAGVILAWLLPKSKDASTLGWILFALLIGWVLIAIAVRQQFYKSLMQTLQSKRLRLGEAEGILHDQTAVFVLRKALANNDEQNVLHALDIIPYCSNADWGSEFSRLMKHHSPAVRTKVLRLYTEFGGLDNTPLISQSLHDTSPSVRAAALHAYCAIGRERAIGLVTRFLQDPDVSVRAASLVGLIRFGGLDGILSSVEQLKNMLQSQEPKERVYGAQVLGDIGVKNFYHPLLALLVDPDRNVRISAIQAATKMKSRELMPALVYRIEDPLTRTAACDALVAFGLQAIKLLSRVLSQSNEPLVTRLVIPGIIARIGNQPAMDALWEYIHHPHEELRTQALEAVHRLRLRQPHLKTTSQEAKRAVSMEIRTQYEQWVVFEDLKLSTKHTLLEETLKHRRKTNLRRIFRLLGCLYPTRSIDTVYNNLSSPSRIIRANALEVLDNMLDKKFKRLLIPLLDDSLIEARLSIGNQVFGTKRLGRMQRLSELMESNLPWLTACAIFTASQANQKELVPDIMTCTASDSALVRETALLALSKLTPHMEFTNTAKRHLKDPSENIRMLAGWLLRPQPSAHREEA